MDLIEQINNLKKSNVKNIVEQRLNEFSTFKNKPEEEWFSELCFCILTANSRAKTAIRIQETLKGLGFLNLDKEKIAFIIKKNHHRFHNHKAEYICEARKFKYIKNIINKMSEQDARKFIVENVKGIGYKEASHFLRNTGAKNLAILDRHIINLMIENKLLERKPKNLNKKNYLEVEEKFNSLAERLKMSSAELDLYMWYMKTGEILK
jgi:N-glycosylase/DNA lyase